MVNGYHSGRKVIEGRLSNLQNEIERLESLKRERDSLKTVTQGYDTSEGANYGKGLVALREAYDKGRANLQPIFVKSDGTSIARPLTFEETIDAVVNAYESGNKGLLTVWNDSCTGIAYKAGTSKFRVVPVSRDLVLLDENFSLPFILVDYANQDGSELDMDRGKYNVPLTQDEALNHPGWLSSVTDRSLLKAFRDIIFAGKTNETAMGYYVRDGPQQDHLRMLEVDTLEERSGADDRYGFGSPARFVLVSPK